MNSLSTDNPGLIRQFIEAGKMKVITRHFIETGKMKLIIRQFIEIWKRKVIVRQFIEAHCRLLSESSLKGLVHDF